jgi:hypothetical protein
VNALVIAGTAWAVCGAVTMAFMVRLTPPDHVVSRRWAQLEEYGVPRWCLIAAVMVCWPLAAWDYRKGAPPPER